MWGGAAYARLQLRESWALSGRFASVADSHGGCMTLGTTAQTVTLTSDHLIASSLRARLEYRGDLAADPVFPKPDGSHAKSQTTLTVGLVYSFSGKIGS